MTCTSASLLYFAIVLGAVGSISGVANQKCGCQPRPDNGHVTYYRDHVEFGCSAGFRLSGPRRLDCGAQGDATQPRCLVDLCGSLDEVENGTTDYIDSVLTPGRNILAQHSCAEGFCLVNGSERQTCLETGVWNGSLPQCVPKRVIRVPVLRQETIEVPIVRVFKRACGSWNRESCATHIMEFVPQVRTVMKFEEQVFDCARRLAVPFPTTTGPDADADT